MVDFEEDDEEILPIAGFPEKRLKVASAQGTSRKQKSERQELDVESAEKSSQKSVHFLDNILEELKSIKKSMNENREDIANTERSIDHTFALDPNQL